MLPLFPDATLPAVASEVAESLRWAHPVVAEWFLARFGSATEPQIEGWPSIVAGRTTLISAPTGSGKTLAAFLVAIDQLLRKAIEGRLGETTEVLYVSPLKALSNDVQKNLDGPLREIQALAIERGYLCGEIRTAVRTGDTLPKHRQQMLRRPPHILVTTPESLYILMTSEKSRNNLRGVRTIIVDEIHAIADDKRGAHLVLTLERLDALVCGLNRLSPGDMVCGRSTPPQRIGLSATQNPLSLVADFLAGSGRGDEVSIVSVGQRRVLDLGIEIPDEELSSVASRGIWESIYNRLAELALEHRSTLVFVNTRTMVERLSFQLSERIGTEHVAAHHGSLSRALRLEAERKLKAGEVKLLVATASLELGIDIGAIDLVCQINSPRAIAPAMQRVGRAGHWRGATPKGRFFVTTRDDLLETAALVQAMRSGVLDRLEIPHEPLDVLMQQIVACCAAEPWEEEALFALARRAYPYRELSRETFEELLCLVSEGIASSRGIWGAYVLRDRVHGHLQARRGARIAAVSNGGTIPDTAIFQVIAQPEGIPIATLDEHFAIDSSPGDVILLGNTSWRITLVEAAGRVLVEDAHGQPPNVPFWTGEAPQRTLELSTFVCALREAIDTGTRGVQPGYISQTDAEVAATTAWLMEQCCLNESAAAQLIGYIVAGRAILGAVPTMQTIVAERFFDEGGGMQLILHAPFGGRINKAWGLALRKRFCRGFNFELQAAATDNGLNISLAEQHSFPLSDVFQFLTEQTVQELLQQACLTSPIFKARWRWDACRSLQLLRFQKGKKVAPQVMRTRGEDLLANVFPQVAACQENIEGDIDIPNHPLVREVMKDTLQEAMDLEGLTRVLAQIRTGEITCLAVDTTTPSQFAHELINANPYAFLDDADLEERRTRAVSLRRTVPDSVLGEAGRLSPDAIAEVRAQQWPDIRDEHELHDQLQLLILVPEELVLDRAAEYTRSAIQASSDLWPTLFARLVASARAAVAVVEGTRFWVTAERLPWVRTLFPSLMLERALPVVAAAEEPAEEVLRRSAQGWLTLLGPASAHALAAMLHVPAAELWKQLLRLEVAGTLMRGVFEYPPAPGELIADHAVEWCDRRLLQRIHKRTLGALRKQVEPATPAVYMQWLLGWQHVAPQTQLAGEAGLVEALRGLEGFEAPAVEWERTLLPMRVANYDPRWLDALCGAGVVGWGRLSPHPAFFAAESGGPRRVIPTSMAPITFFLREEALWLDAALTTARVPDENLACCLSELALAVRACIAQRGAMFASDLLRAFAVPSVDLDRALWELVAAGLVTADGFDSLRLLIDPRRKQLHAPPPGAKRAARHAAGRWSLLCGEPEQPWIATTGTVAAVDPARARGAAAERHEAQLASACCMLLQRYGVVFRDVLEREANIPKWRELLPMLRRMEARGEVRGGRFLSGFSGEQFALPEALQSLREVRQQGVRLDLSVTVAAADPLNLLGIVIPGERVAAVAGKTLCWSHATLTSLSAAPPAAISAQASHDLKNEQAAFFAPATPEHRPQP
ncbi:DEAD/DEAH box helicase [Acidipila sp. EB88]|uniref:DEAD/DEAH box helicase n=1 Tax=Acidipila sp. EB88 TaxID=2305226 RepID=UPI000F5E62D2|nr:DEAD/DEAH box helicase [Acidipila sp. EB88]RRA48612.1 DEAD/DEAH box helicase [Acidipila sp. EB88]